MDLNIYETPGYTIIEPAGDLSSSGLSCQIHQRVREILDNKINHIIIDMGKVNYINSVCISSLIGSFISTRNAGGELKLANLTPKVGAILSVTKLNLVFNIYDAVDEAAASYN